MAFDFAQDAKYVGVLLLNGLSPPLGFDFYSVSGIGVVMVYWNIGHGLILFGLAAGVCLVPYLSFLADWFDS
jgi:hypothetical protein